VSHGWVEDVSARPNLPSVGPPTHIRVVGVRDDCAIQDESQWDPVHVRAHNPVDTVTGYSRTPRGMSLRPDMSATSPLSVVVVDDHPLVRVGIRAVLESLSGVTCVGEASSVESALALIESVRPDVVLVDISLKDGSGLTVVREAGRRWPSIRMVILSMHAGEEYVLEALREGAAGYLLKDSAGDELARAFESLRRGEIFLSARVAQRVVVGYAGRSGGSTPEARALSRRQQEVLKLIAGGLSSKDIARTLGLSVKTVETHRAQIVARLGIRDVAGLTKYAIRIGLLDEG
jgi:DNA-binding NarL/FixJ family response regulator